MIRRPAGRFWFEGAGDDLPFYDDRPMPLSWARWLAVLFALVAGFAALIAPVPALQTLLAGFAPSILFFGLPLAALAIMAPRDWTRLFRPIAPRDVLWMIVFAALNLAVTMLVGYLVQRFLGASSNPLIAHASAMSASERLLLFAKTILQLFGEELLTILPFLAVLSLLHRALRVPRRSAILVGWVLSAVLFGAAHLPTYDWNLAQSLLIIGSARLVLTAPYVMTKNIWVSTGAHVLNDWALLGAAMLFAQLPS